MTIRRVFQLVSSEDGVRSPAFVSTREELGSILSRDVDGVASSDLVLVLGELDEADEFSFVNAPLMRVDTFAEHFGAKQ